MIVCLNCGKENQDHYKFCLGCGAKLPGPGGATARTSQQRPPVSAPSAPKTVVSPRTNEPPSAPQPAASLPPLVQPARPAPAPPVVAPAAAPPVVSSAPTPPGLSAVAAPKPPMVAPPPVSAPAPVPAPVPAPAAVLPAPEVPAPCSQCGMANPPGFRFCGNCGNRLTMVPAAAPVAAPAPTPVAQSAPTAATPRAAAPTGRARLTLIRIDGSEGGSIEIEGGPTVFGRIYGSPFDGDFYLSPRHCAFSVFPEGVKIDDIGGSNGVYRKLEGRTDLQDGDMFRVGQELLYYEDLPEPAPLDDGTERMGSPNPGYWGRVSVLIDGKIACEAHPIAGDEFMIGRERGDLTFPLDGYVSSSHCRIVGDDSGVFLEDRGSSNGTYVRLRPGSTVPYGALILAGQQLFRLDRVS